MNKFKNTIKSSEITPEAIYASRRKFMKLGVWAFSTSASAAMLAACGGGNGSGADKRMEATQVIKPTLAAADKPDVKATDAPAAKSAMPKDKDELGNALTPFENITNYNNYYEFSTDKEAVAGLAANYKTDGWKVEIGGLVNKPMTLSMDDLLKKFAQEERVYRHRCVEGWSMVMPWTGFALNALLKEADPKSDAKFVRFVSPDDSKQMPGQNDIFSGFQWPYSEALRLDEAMNDLAFMVTGLYGKPLPIQNGAPVRLALPWKYGFKSGKAIVKIELVAAQPKTFWTVAAPTEYGFYANVNPAVPHPRWTQATERRIGENGRRKTLPFNGYAEQVAKLYDGMDLVANY